MPTVEEALIAALGLRSDLLADALDLVVNTPAERRVGDPFLCRKYKLSREGDRFWKTVWKKHPLLFQKHFIFKPEDDLARNWFDAIYFFESPNGYHWTAVTTEHPECWVGDKRKLLPRDFQTWRSDYRPSRAHLQRLYDSPMVAYEGIYHSHTEEIDLRFPGFFASGECQLCQAFDGWRFGYHIRRHFYSGTKKHHYDTASDAATIRDPAYPSRSAAIEAFFVIARRFYVDPRKDADKGNLAALEATLREAQEASMHLCEK